MELVWLLEAVYKPQFSQFPPVWTLNTNGWKPGSIIGGAGPDCGSAGAHPWKTGKRWGRERGKEKRGKVSKGKRDKGKEDKGMGTVKKEGGKEKDMGEKRRREKSTGNGGKKREGRSLEEGHFGVFMPILPLPPT